MRQGNQELIKHSVEELIKPGRNVKLERESMVIA
jgi:hypothetical protein